MIPTRGMQKFRSAVTVAAVRYLVHLSIIHFLTLARAASLNMRITGLVAACRYDATR